jgi:hypothetical protein
MRNDVPRGAHCRICLGEQFMFAQELPYLRSPGLCRFVVCSNCGTVFDAGSFEQDYRGDSNTRYESADIKFYVEYGAGLEHLAMLLGALDQALQDFDRLVTAPDDVPVEFWPTIYRQIGMAHLRLGQFRRARAWLNKAHSSL